MQIQGASLEAICKLPTVLYSESGDKYRIALTSMSFKLSPEFATKNMVSTSASFRAEITCSHECAISYSLFMLTWCLTLLPIVMSG